MLVKIVDNVGHNPIGQVAQAELHFTEADGPLAGLKLIGFAIWERRSQPGAFNVTFPARQYSVNGERRSFALLRPAGGEAHAQDAIRELILATYLSQQAPQQAVEQ